MRRSKTRREFITASARYGAAFGMAGMMLGETGCARGEEYETVIAGGVVYDGGGTPGKEMDIGISGNRIAAIGRNLKVGKNGQRLDVRGLAVAPGFIDPHTHTDRQLLINPRAESKIRQGVTVELGGNCGSSFFPGSDKHPGQDLNDFYTKLEQQGIALNYASLVGHGAIRTYAMGAVDRPPTEKEMHRMRGMLRSCLEAGALGMSTGLYYAPGSFAATGEIVELCRELVPFHGIYATHIRDESDSVLESIEEAISIARQSGASLQISHVKAMYRRNFAKLPGILERIDAAVREGISVLADRYPYIASSTALSALYPRWTQEGGSADFVAKLKVPSNDRKLREHLREIEKKLVSWDSILICGVHTGKNSGLVGKTVLQAAQASGKPAFEFTRDLLIEEQGKVDIVNFAMDEENLKRVLAHPRVVIGSDGFALAASGELSGGKPHPRSYGTFPRVLGTYVREKKVLTLPEAIRKMTSLTAEKFGLPERGYLRPGYHADVVVFNPETVADRADWVSPHQYPSGIEYVLVNGTVVINRGEHTGALPGKCLRREVT